MAGSKRAMVVLAALLALLPVSAPAMAHYLYKEGYVWQNGGGACLTVRAELSHGNSSNYYEGYTRVDQRPLSILNTPKGAVHCGQTMSLPAGYQAQLHRLYRWNGSSWAYCTDHGWLYSSRDSRDYSGGYWETSKYWRIPCGKGYYKGYGNGQIYFNNAWVGGWMHAGNPDEYHYLPSP